MRSHLRRQLLPAIVVAWAAWLWAGDGRGATIKEILDQNGGKLTVGAFTFTFTEQSVSADPETPPNGATFTPPTTSSVDVVVVKGGLMFDFQPFLDFKYTESFTQKIYISYTVSATADIMAAGLSFSGLAVDIDTRSEVIETFTGLNESLDVFTARDGRGEVSGQNNQSTMFANPQTTLMVRNEGLLTTPTRGDGAKSTTQLSSITNTFTIPEPASIVSGSIGGALALGVLLHRSRRTPS